MIAALIFWIALAGVSYVYIGYPLLLMAWRALARRPVHKQAYEPTASLVIAMHNEAANVVRKMRNCQELEYPPGKLQVIVSLDAPTDSTFDLLRNCALPGLEIVSSSIRQGKAVAVNRGVAAATGEILVFGDAAQRLESHALRELVANFADESVGAVSGALVLLDTCGREATDAGGAYWRYEKVLRGLESDIHSVPGATGAIYAVRRSLFVPLPQGTLLDDVAVPMKIVLGGHRVILDPSARAYDRATNSAECEYHRKRRTCAGNYQLLAQMPDLLLPWRNPIFVQFVSHKVGRLLVPYGLAALFISNLFLLRDLYLVAFATQVLFYGMAAVGRWFSYRAVVLPYTFVLMNWAALAGLRQFARGTSGIWNPTGLRRTLG
jgi:cellulose synthase/poly-beta-1,6-N-acetylglucosamine synthase-like glycosyltransferase